MRQKNDQSLSEVIGAFILENKLKPQLNETKIKNLWEDLMGKTIATYTSNIVVRKGILYISILSAPLRQELSFSKDKIKSLLNDELGEEFITEVVIR
jgi:hypothetical protein